MRVISNKQILEHPGNDLESPERVLGIVSTEVEIDQEEAIQAINSLYRTEELNLELVKKMCNFENEIAEVKLNKNSYGAILASVSLALQVSRSKDFAIIRPPGHHANLVKPKGFCLINNIAVVVKHLLDQGKKILIIDFDGHHGDGTQDIFENNELVFLCSLYQKDAYPFVIGFEAPKSKNGLYISLESGSGDDIFRQTFDLFIKKTEEFKPDIIAVSAGFDGYHTDPLLNLNFTEESFYYAGQQLKMTNLPVFALLEGGYHKNLNECVYAFVDGYNGIVRKFKNQKTKSE